MNSTLVANLLNQDKFSKDCYNLHMLNKTLIFTTDIHGTLSAKSYVNNQLRPNGLSRVSTYVKNLRKTNEVLLADNGDSLQGSPLLTYAIRNKLSPTPLTKVMNHMEYDFLNVGNHDFNYGESILQDYIDLTFASCLTTNVLYKGVPIGSSQIHHFSDGTKIGLIGIVTDYIPHWEKADHIKHYTFLDPIETVKQEVCELRENVDYVIVLYHGGLEKDPITGKATESLTGENVGYELSKIKCIDAIISGHQHRSINTNIHDTLFMQATLNAAELMRIDIVDKKLKAELVSMATIEIDQEIEDLLKPYEKDVNTWLDTVLGTLEDGDCFVSNPFEARYHKHPVVSFLNQVQTYFTMAQISSTALFNEPLGFPKDIRMRDIVNNYVYPNSLVVKKMCGLDLKAYLEQNANYFIVKDNQIIVNPDYDDPKPQHFNYDMLDGIEYTYKISNPIGHRLIECTYNGKTITDMDHFTVVMNNYRASGGGNFNMIPEAITVAELPLDMTDLIAEYIQKNNPVKIQHKDNIKIIL